MLANEGLKSRVPMVLGAAVAAAVALATPAGAQDAGAGAGKGTAAAPGPGSASQTISLGSRFGRTDSGPASGTIRVTRMMASTKATWLAIEAPSAPPRRFS